ncbi:MAG: hypothetical protein ACI8Z7_000394 [Candidatus Nanohaloarchaea archaeon]|jgi:hypothetical protein
MSTRSLSSQAHDVLTDDKRDDVILYLSKNSEATSEDPYEKQEYVAVARSLKKLDYVESEINNGEMVWTTEEDFSYNSVLEEVEEALENHERQG